MAQTREGALKRSAKQRGLSLQEYKQRLQKGEKWCFKCQCWKLTSQFGVDKSRHDGLSAVCFSCKRVKERKTRKGCVSVFKGRTHTLEAKEKMSRKRMGNVYRVGKKHTPETRARISQTVRMRTPHGKQCHSYKDGKLAERRGLRFSPEYKRWRFDVFARDKFTCQECGDNRGGNLVAHHIKPFAEYPDLRFDVTNGLTLCVVCHDKHHYGAKED